MRAQDVGWSANRIVLGKHSGRNAFRSRLQEIGIEFRTEEELNEAFSRFKDLADKKHEIFDEDLQALVTESGLESANDWLRLLSLKVCSETGETPYARLTLWVDGAERPAQAPGSGPVDASFKAIEALIDSGTELQLYSVNNITSGTDSQGEVTVRLQKGGRIVNGQGADTDIVIASAKAYINALNKIIQRDERAHPQLGDV
jgi:2-isopropylmalate synthase